MALKVVFMGSGSLACPSLSQLLADDSIEVAAVVTQPDRPKGRSLKITPCEVKLSAADAGITLLAPVNVNTEATATIAEIAPDLIVVVAYGQILKKELLDIPRYGCINVHASLLPKYRGAGPIQWAIANGDKVTGVTTMFMDEGMDTGDMILKREFPIAADDSAGLLQDKLAAIGGELLMATIAAIRSGTVERKPQDSDAATYARKLKKQDGRIDWSWSAEKIECRVRGFTPWPGSFCTAPARTKGGEERGCRIRVLGVRVEPGTGRPGCLLEIGKDGPLVATGDGALRLLEVQPEGKRAMQGAAFLCGHALEVGEMFR